MLKRQVDRAPAPQWVRVVGGFTEHQFAEKRLPTLDELNAVAPDTPVFILHLYDRALLNAAALRVSIAHSQQLRIGERVTARRDREAAHCGAVADSAHVARTKRAPYRWPALTEMWMFNSRWLSLTS